MKRPALSHVFDSDMQFLDAATFDEVVMAEVELFNRKEFEQICDDLQYRDVKSLIEILNSLNVYLTTRDRSKLVLTTNIVFDHCMEKRGNPDDFKIYLLTNTIEWMISVKQLTSEASSAQFSQNEEQE
jgi:hypothetical protein